MCGVRGGISHQFGVVSVQRFGAVIEGNRNLGELLAYSRQKVELDR